MKRTQILEFLLLATLMAKVCLIYGNDALITEAIAERLSQTGLSVSVKYLPGLVVEVTGIHGFRILCLRSKDVFDNFLELRFSRSEDSKRIENQDSAILATLWNCTQLDRCVELQQSEEINANKNSPTRIWFTFKGSFKAGLGVDLKSFEFLVYTPQSYLDTVSAVTFMTEDPPATLLIRRTLFVNKCLVLNNETLEAKQCGNEFTSKILCLNCGCCYNPDVLLKTSCLQPIGAFSKFIDYSLCTLPQKKIADNFIFLSNGPACNNANVSFFLGYILNSSAILQLSFDVDFGDGESIQSQTIRPFISMPSWASARHKIFYAWDSDHTYKESGFFEVKATVSNKTVLISKTSVVVERAPLPPSDCHIIVDEPALVEVAVDVMLLAKFFLKPMEVVAWSSDNDAPDKIAMNKFHSFPEWMENSLHSELDIFQNMPQGDTTNISNRSQTNSENQIRIYHSIFRHVFTKSDTYKVTFMMKTICGETEVTKQVFVNDRSAVRLDEYLLPVVASSVSADPVHVLEEVGIVVALTQLTRNTFVEIHFGDQTPAVSFLPHRGMNLPAWVRQLGVKPNQSCVITSHRYSAAGTFEIHVIIEDILWNQVINKKLEVEVTCSANMTFPGYTDYIEKRVNESLMVQYEISQNCTGASLSEKWSIHQVSDSEAKQPMIPVPLPFNVEIRPGLWLLVPPYALTSATYVIELKVFIPLNTVNQDENHKMVDRQLQVRFRSAGILVDLRAPEKLHLFPFPASGVFDTVLKLDASRSKDLDDPIQSSTGLTFTWLCSAENSFDFQASPVDGSSCHENTPVKLPFSESVIQYKVSSDTIATTMNKIYFRVLITKPGRSPGNATRTIRLIRSYNAKASDVEPTPHRPEDIQEPFTPYIIIVCLRNCNKTINPRKDLLLNAFCANCPFSDALRFQWSFLVEGDNSSRTSSSLINLEAAAEDGTDKPDLLIEAGTFEDIEAGETFFLSVNVTRKTGQEVTAEYGFFIPSAEELPP